MVARFGDFGHFSGVVDIFNNFSKDNGDVMTCRDFIIIMSIIHDMDEFMEEDVGQTVLALDDGSPKIEGHNLMTCLGNGSSLFIVGRVGCVLRFTDESGIFDSGIDVLSIDGVLEFIDFFDQLDRVCG